MSEKVIELNLGSLPDPSSFSWRPPILLRGKPYNQTTTLFSTDNSTRKYSINILISVPYAMNTPYNCLYSIG